MANRDVANPFAGEMHMLTAGARRVMKHKLTRSSRMRVKSIIRQELDELLDGVPIAEVLRSKKPMTFASCGADGSVYFTRED